MQHEPLPAVRGGAKKLVDKASFAKLAIKGGYLLITLMLETAIAV